MERYAAIQRVHEYLSENWGNLAGEGPIGSHIATYDAI